MIEICPAGPPKLPVETELEPETERFSQADRRRLGQFECAVWGGREAQAECS
jgi:hypothetical protein